MFQTSYMELQDETTVKRQTGGIPGPGLYLRPQSAGRSAEPPDPGKLADLIVLEKNPLKNIRNSEHIRYTVLNGRIYNARTMDEIGNHPRKRGKFYWEMDYSIKR